MSIGTTSLDVSVEQTSRNFDPDVVPTSLERYVEDARQRNQQMNVNAPEGPVWAANVAARQSVTQDFLASAPKGLTFGSGTNCTGVGCATSNGGLTYAVQRTVGSDVSSLQPDVFRRTNSGEEVVGTLESPGRMNGDFGWGSARDLIAGALASYTHNFVSSLLAYFERPSLPYSPDDGWQLPNLVLDETEDPSQFHPAGSFKFNLRPSVLRRVLVDVQAPTDVRVGLDIWNSDKESVARRDDLQVNEGTGTIQIVTIGPTLNTGYLNIEPLDAPQGMTITNVTTFPRV